MAVAGKVSITLDGVWEASKEYDRLCGVKHNNSLFISRKKPPIGVEPVDGDYWMLVIDGISNDEWDGLINDVTNLDNKIDNLTADDVGAVPTERKVNGKALTSDISLSASDVGARASDWMPSASDVGAAASSHNQAASTITAGTFGATGVKAANGTDYTTARVRNIVFTTTDPGASASSSYGNGALTCVYE